MARGKTESKRVSGKVGAQRRALREEVLSLRGALLNAETNLTYLNDEHAGLHKAVSDLYYAAHWTADREVDAGGLWTRLRDAAKLEPGKAPKEIAAK